MLEKDLRNDNKIPGCTRMTRPEEISSLGKFLGYVKEVQEENTKLEKNNLQVPGSDAKIKNITELEDRLYILDKGGVENPSLVHESEVMPDGNRAKKVTLKTPTENIPQSFSSTPISLKDKPEEIPGIQKQIKDIQSQKVDIPDLKEKVESLKDRKENLEGQIKKINELEENINKIPGEKKNIESLKKEREDLKVSQEVSELSREVDKIKNISNTRQESLNHHQENIPGSISSPSSLSTSSQHLPTEPSNSINLDRTKEMVVGDKKVMDKLELSKESLPEGERSKGIELEKEVSEVPGDKQEIEGLKKNAESIPGKIESTSLSEQLSKIPGEKTNPKLDNGKESIPGKIEDLEELGGIQNKIPGENINLESLPSDIYSLNDETELESLSEYIDELRELEKEAALSTKREDIEVEENPELSLYRGDLKVNDDPELSDYRDNIEEVEDKIDNLSSYIDTLEPTPDFNNQLSTKVEGIEGESKDIDSLDDSVVELEPGTEDIDSLSDYRENIELKEINSLSKHQEYLQGITDQKTLSGHKEKLEVDSDPSLSLHREDLDLENKIDSLSDYRENIEVEDNPELSDYREDLDPEDKINSLSDYKESIKVEDSSELSDYREDLDPEDKIDSLEDWIDLLDVEDKTPSLSSKKESLLPHQQKTGEIDCKIRENEKDEDIAKALEYFLGRKILEERKLTVGNSEEDNINLSSHIESRPNHNPKPGEINWLIKEKEGDEEFEKAMELLLKGYRDLMGERKLTIGNSEEDDIKLSSHKESRPNHIPKPKEINWLIKESEWDEEIEKAQALLFKEYCKREYLEERKLSIGEEDEDSINLSEYREARVKHSPKPGKKEWKDHVDIPDGYINGVPTPTRTLNDPVDWELYDSGVAIPENDFSDNPDYFDNTNKSDNPYQELYGSGVAMPNHQGEINWLTKEENKEIDWARKETEYDKEIEDKQAELLKDFRKYSRDSIAGNDDKEKNGWINKVPVRRGTENEAIKWEELIKQYQTKTEREKYDLLLKELGEQGEWGEKIASIFTSYYNNATSEIKLDIKNDSTVKRYEHVLKKEGELIGIWDESNFKFKDYPGYGFPKFSLNAIDPSVWLRSAAEAIVGHWVHGSARQLILNETLGLLVVARDYLEKVAKSARDRLPGDDGGMLGDVVTGGAKNAIGNAAGRIVSAAGLEGGHASPGNRPLKTGFQGMGSDIKPTEGWQPMNERDTTLMSNKDSGNKKSIFNKILAGAKSSLLGGSTGERNYKFKDNYINSIGIFLTLRELCLGTDGSSVGSVEQLFQAIKQSPFMTSSRKFTSGTGGYVVSTLDSNAFWEIILEPYLGNDNGNISFLPCFNEMNTRNIQLHGVNTNYNRYIPAISFDLQKSKLTSKTLGLYDGEISYPVSMELMNEFRLTIVDDQFKSWKWFFETAAEVSIYSSIPHSKSYYNGNQGCSCRLTIPDTAHILPANYKNVTWRCRIFCMTPQLSTTKYYDLLLVLKDIVEEYSGELEGPAADLSLSFSIVGENPNTEALPVKDSSGKDMTIDLNAKENQKLDVKTGSSLGTVLNSGVSSAMKLITK